MTELRAVGDPFYVRDGDRTVVARKVFTGTGERLELVSESLGRRVRLDAIALEAVAWQDRSTLAEPAADIEEGGPSPPPEGPEREEPMRLRNEFADAVVEAVEVDGREGLSIAAPKLGYEVRLGVPELEWLTTQGHDRFTEWLEHPFGPAADEH
jgi:hypothetical protein